MHFSFSCITIYIDIYICIYKRANILCTRSLGGRHVTACRNIKLDSLSLKFIILVNSRPYLHINDNNNLAEVSAEVP